MSMVKKIFRRKSAEQRRSLQIEKQLTSDHIKQLQKRSVLLLGAGESGKTTILKQMRIIHDGEYDIKERKERIIDIRNNIHDSMYKIVSNLNKVKPIVPIQSKKTQKIVEYFLALGAMSLEEYSQEYYDKIEFLWNDKDIQEMYRRGNEYHLLDSTEEFMGRLNEIRKDDYIPSTQDILYCRVRTTTIKTIEFKVKYSGQNVQFIMHDVGGQRGERKKLMPMFEDIETLLFVISVSDFDQNLREDESTNRLEEALTLFNNMYNSRYLQTTNAIIFLNKVDILEKKINNGISIGTYFADYKHFKDLQNTQDEFINTKLFIKNKVDMIIKAGNPNRNAYIHFTIATNTDNIKKITKNINDILIEKALNDLIPF